MRVTPVEERLAGPHAHYVRRINAAVAAGRMDLVRDLADEYEDEALELMIAGGGGIASRPAGPAEILEFGGGGVVLATCRHMAVPVLAARQLAARAAFRRSR